MIGLLCTTPAVAQVATQLAARRLLIDRARVAQRAGDHATALELASSALRIRSTASLLLFIAEELVGLGREVEALGNVERCLLAAQTERAVPAVAQNCRLLQARLRSRVVGLTTRCVPESVQISIDGGEPTACGVTALSPGSHQVEARAVGYVSRAIVLVLAGGETRSESIALEPLPPDEPPPLPPPPAASAPVATAALQVRPPAPRPSPSAARRRPPLVGPMVLGASGLALVLASPLLFFARDQLAEGCRRTPDDALACPNDAALADATLANDRLHPMAITAAAAGSAALLGALLWGWRRGVQPVVGVGLSAQTPTLLVGGRF